nr:hypothetical protein [Rhodovulum adriaticum]
MTWQGQPVADDRPFVIATNSYRAGGGGQYPGTGPDSVIHAGTEASRDILLRHIADQGTVHPGAVSPWQFAPMPGTSVLFDTGPGALHHLPGVTGLAIEPAGKAPGGFLRFRIHL